MRKKGSLELGTIPPNISILFVPALQCRNDFRKVIADETKSNVFCELFDDSSKSVLSVVRHRVGFVEDDLCVGKK